MMMCVWYQISDFLECVASYLSGCVLEKQVTGRFHSGYAGFKLTVGIRVWIETVISVEGLHVKSGNQLFLPVAKLLIIMFETFDCTCQNKDPFCFVSDNLNLLNSS